jgi:gamma-glutamyltranspeptidase/glutathione hydrolase
MTSHMVLRIGITFLTVTTALFAQGRNYGRSTVITQQGIVATSQTLASQAGAQILARGGSAVDAAIAANAALAVMEPMMDSLGGDLFVLYWDAETSKLTGLNASGPAPRGLSPEFLAKAGIKEMPREGINSVTVPGVVDGWAKLYQRYGKLPWKDLFQAAIVYAESGFPVPEVIRQVWMHEQDIKLLRTHAESEHTFLPDGKVPQVGDIFRNPAMGRAFRLIAEQGRDAYYKREIASAILKTSERLGGTMTAEDLASFSSEWVTPISIDYRGWRVFELPPNGQGMAALEMLNIMEQFPPAQGGAFSAEEMHTRIEAMKLAYSDLRRYNADPHFSDVPVGGLLSKKYARERATLIKPGKANCDVAPGGPIASDTTYLTVVDKRGNIASWIQSEAGLWGSGITVEGMGFILQNRGGGFKLEPKHPDVLKGGKRPFHTIIPAFMEKSDEHIGFGIMGGPMQPTGHAQFVSNLVDFSMNLQQALDGPRFGPPEITSMCSLGIESRVPMASLQSLFEWGHILKVHREYDALMGRGQAILHNSKTRINYAASDPRGDGSAEPEPLVF